RQLIRNGEQVTAFALGGYHSAKSLNPKQTEKLIESAIETGVRFFDNARGYHQGTAEEYYGKFLTPKYRDDIFLMTKSHGKSKAEVEEHMEQSMRAMQTDQLDLWTIHTFSSIEDVDKRINQGVLDFFLEAKQKGKTRYIGFSCHTNPKVALYFLEFLEKRGLELDTCQCPVNVCDPSFESFQKQLLPVLLKKKYGIIAMKSMAGGGMIGRRFDLTPRDFKDDDIKNITKESEVTLDQLHQYVYSLPVSALCSGCETVEEIEHNTGILKNMKILEDSEMKKIASIAQPYAGRYAEHYKRIL
ncbi:MAG TPA: aldo/keto reductase, partial [Draconibacterium sp.]|nr:aldo/keto reductase [Draconibacterium sp.]